MISITNHDTWHLDDNGINVVNDVGHNVMDLRNEFKITDVSLTDTQIVLVLLKHSDEIHSQYINKGQMIRFVLQNCTDTSSIPGNIESSTFEGIYDFTPISLSVCIDSECYRVKGDNIK